MHACVRARVRACVRVCVRVHILAHSTSLVVDYGIAVGYVNTIVTSSSQNNSAGNVKLIRLNKMR